MPTAMGQAVAEKSGDGGGGRTSYSRTWYALRIDPWSYLLGGLGCPFFFSFFLATGLLPAVEETFFYRGRNDSLGSWLRQHAVYDLPKRRIIH